ncbi:MAG TPA: homoserine kinase [Trebonia sp.]|nr:homoserine kinase [Trebonia sp.]
MSRGLVSWPAGAVRVKVPATSANLGPGFDALGLALALHDEVEAQVIPGGLDLHVTGEGAAEVAGAGGRHLVVRAMRTAFDDLGTGQPPGLALRCVNRIPHGRGLGSSAAAIVAGILAARALAGAEVAPGAALPLASAIEGHPDNVAPCLYGGLTVAWLAASGQARAIRLEPLAQVRPVAVIAPAPVSTEVARGLLPTSVSHGDAAANAGRAALLVAALTTAPDALLDATEDRLHQAYRAPAMPHTHDLVVRLRAAGIAAVVSGAGPSVLAFPDASAPTRVKLDSTIRETGIGWIVSPLDVERQGASVTPDTPEHGAGSVPPALECADSRRTGSQSVAELRPLLPQHGWPRSWMAVKECRGLRWC